MSRPTLDQIPTTVLDNPRTFYTSVKTLLANLESQLQNQPVLSSRADNKTEEGLRKMDVMCRLSGGRLQLGIFDGKKFRPLNNSDLQSLQSLGTNYKGKQTGTTAVGAAGTLLLFPLQNDWGFYHRTSVVSLFLVYNLTGATLLSVQLT